MNPRILRGRCFRAYSVEGNCLSVTWLRPMPLGRYSRVRLPAFASLPRFQGLKGVGQIQLIAGPQGSSRTTAKPRTSRWKCFAHSRSPRGSEMISKPWMVIGNFLQVEAQSLRTSLSSDVWTCQTC